MVVWGWIPLVAELCPVSQLFRNWGSNQLLPFKDLVSRKLLYLPLLWSDFDDLGLVGLLLLCWNQCCNLLGLDLDDSTRWIQCTDGLLMMELLPRYSCCTSKLANSTPVSSTEPVLPVTGSLVVFYSSVVWVSTVESHWKCDRSYEIGATEYRRGAKISQIPSTQNNSKCEEKQGCRLQY